MLNKTLHVGTEHWGKSQVPTKVQCRNGPAFTEDHELQTTDAYDKGSKSLVLTTVGCDTEDQEAGSQSGHLHQNNPTPGQHTQY